METIPEQLLNPKHSVDEQTFLQNQSILRKRYPNLASRLDIASKCTSISLQKNNEGHTVVSLTKDGRNIPITPPFSVLETQFHKQSEALSDLTKPVLLVGLYPGIELISIFEHGSHASEPQPDQHIYVVIDSILCLWGFLLGWDVRTILQSSRVHFIWHEDIPRWINQLRTHPEIPYLFTFISGCKDATLQQLMPPIVHLVQDKEASTQQLIKENNDYYDALDNHSLIQILQSRAERKPRLMMPICAWSTFMQYGARDLCTAFTEAGWDTYMLRVDAMLTPHYLAQQIHDIRPDLFIFINHARCEAEEIYPKNLMFVTWIQDEMEHLLNNQAGRKFSSYAKTHQRDLFVGYTQAYGSSLYGYPKDRLIQSNIPADIKIFRPMTLGTSEHSKYDAQVALVSHVSRPSEEIVDKLLIPYTLKHGLPQETVHDIHTYLWKAYREGKSFTDRKQFMDQLNTFDPFKSYYESLNTHEKLQLQILFYWRLNDTIFRHVVLEWVIDQGIDLHLYGRGWEKHPTFFSYAKGTIQHGSELNKVYQCSKLNLHLNVTNGMHQRLWEILSAGAIPLIRSPYPKPTQPLDYVMRYLAQAIYNQNLDEEEVLQLIASQKPNETIKSLQNFLFQMLIKQSKSNTTITPINHSTQISKIILTLKAQLQTEASWWFKQWEELSFYDLTSFKSTSSKLLQEEPASSIRNRSTSSYFHQGIIRGNSYAQFRDDLFVHLKTLIGTDEIMVGSNGRTSPMMNTLYQRLTPLTLLTNELNNAKHNKFESRASALASIRKAFNAIDKPSPLILSHVAKVLIQCLEETSYSHHLLQSIDPNEIIEQDERMEYFDLLTRTGNLEEAITRCREVYASSKCTLINGYSRIGWTAYLNHQSINPLTLFAKDTAQGTQSEPWKLKQAWLLIEQNLPFEATSLLNTLQPSDLPNEQDQILHHFITTLLKSMDTDANITAMPLFLGYTNAKEIINSLHPLVQMTLFRCTGIDRTSSDDLILNTLIDFLTTSVNQQSNNELNTIELARLYLLRGCFPESLEIIKNRCTEKTSLYSGYIVLAMNSCIHHEYRFAEDILNRIVEPVFIEPIHLFRYAVVLGLVGQDSLANTVLHKLFMIESNFFMHQKYPTKWFMYAIMLKALSQKQAYQEFLRCADKFDFTSAYRKHWLDTIKQYPLEGTALELPLFTVPK